MILSQRDQSPAPNVASSSSTRFNPMLDVLFKEQEQLLKRASLFKAASRYGASQVSPKQNESLAASMMIDSKSTKSPKEGDDVAQDLTMGPLNEEDVPDDDDELVAAAAKIPLDEILGKGRASIFRDPFRYDTPSSDCSSIEEETRCVICNANFPSVWLLEQHASLQHATLDEKPFICEQCGQSYRYRSAYLKHREQNHRARLPADKLFTCDVCGMQFRYLKSFKKHRLNHALERLHGKFERFHGKFGQQTMAQRKALPCDNNNDIVTSSNEAMTDAATALTTIKTEVEEEEQDDTIDSMTARANIATNPMTNIERRTPGTLLDGRIKLSETLFSGQIHRDTAAFLLKVRHCSQRIGRAFFFDYFFDFDSAAVYAEHSSTTSHTIADADNASTAAT